MSQLFEALQEKYRDLVARSLESGRDEILAEDMRTFVIDARQAGKVITDPEERGQLRAYIRFIAITLQQSGYDAGEIGLMPLDRERWVVRRSSGIGKDRVPIWVWLLAGGAAVVVLAGLIGMAGFSITAASLRPTATVPPSTSTPLPPTATPTSTPTTTPVPTPTRTPRPAPSAFSNLRVGLGITPPGTPLLVSDEFDWNTKVIFAAFDYEGMRADQDWSVVWTRDGVEVLREDYRGWDVGHQGSAGTSWIVYHNNGTVIIASNYTVSLYIEGELQAEASFVITPYQPATP